MAFVGEEAISEHRVRILTSNAEVHADIMPNRLQVGFDLSVLSQERR